MADVACGGTHLSGLLYHAAGVTGTLWGAAILAPAAALAALRSPPVNGKASWDAVKGDEWSHARKPIVIRISQESANGAFPVT